LIDQIGKVKHVHVDAAVETRSVDGIATFRSQCRVDAQRKQNKIEP
jgi:hypothetical protein